MNLKKGDHTSRDLNNYNDVLDIDADGMVGAETGLYAGGGGVELKYQVTQKPDENGFYYIIYSESGKKVPSSKLPTNIGYGKINNEFLAKRKNTIIL